ncbi:MAG: 2-oxo acid dehydrogenase subunit E2 [Acholeplasmataceae bacterium]|nr:2-oxo acid dehydrogenase subunit E2 [Acholeplasmataceae bacterium]
MFGKRCDGKRIKGIDPLFKLIPHVMFERHDASNSMTIKVDCQRFDDYIAEKKTQGIHINYMHIVIAAIVRVHALRPCLNRFIMNGKVYKRNGIFVSLSVKKQLKEDAEETTIKLPFKGTESLLEVKEQIDQSIIENCNPKENQTDKTAKMFSHMSNFVLKYAVKFIKFLDRHGMAPKSLIQTSPFHTSCYLTNLKSIHMDYIFHHLYDFGTTGMFISMGKEKMEPVVNQEMQIFPGKIMNLGIVADERLCDGLYHANSLRLFKKILENPKIMDTPLDEIVQDID